MMDEKALVAAILHDRAAYDRLAGRLDPKDFGEYGQLVVRAAADFYKRDGEARSVDVGTVESAIRRGLASPKHGDSAVRYLSDLPTEVSSANVVAEYRLLRRHNIGLELAAALGSGRHGDSTDALLERYRELGVEHETQADKLSLEEVPETVGEGNQIKLLPGALNERVGGGVLRGHNITVFGRPESGKTAFSVNLAAPEANMGDITGDLSSRRGQGTGTGNLAAGMMVVQGVVPLAELDGYSGRLKAMTQGSGSFSMELADYQPVPPAVQQQLAAAYKRKDEED